MTSRKILMESKHERKVKCSTSLANTLQCIPVNNFCLSQGLYGTWSDLPGFVSTLLSLLLSLGDVWTHWEHTSCCVILICWFPCISGWGVHHLASFQSLISILVVSPVKYFNVISLCTRKFLGCWPFPSVTQDLHLNYS